MASEYLSSNACDKSELLPVALAHMSLPAVLKMEQEPSHMVSEQKLSAAALDQMPPPMCNGFELLPVTSEQIPSPV